MVTNVQCADILSKANSIPELISIRAQLTPNDNALADQLNSDSWQWLSWSKLNTHIEATAKELLSQGFGYGDSIGIIASTSVLWDISQYAILKNDGVVVGIDSHDTKKNIHKIIKTSSIKGIITDSQKKMENLLGPFTDELAIIVEIGSKENLNQISLKKIHARSSDPVSISPAPPCPEDTATIIFTSGTTGDPKGIPYSHKQVLSACQAITRTYSDVTETANLACWLPLSNLFQRMMNYCAIAAGAKIYYVSDPKEIVRYLPLINPTVFIAVPRFYEKLYEGIQGKINALSAPLKQLFSFAHKANSWSSQTNSLVVNKLVNTITDVFVFNRFKSGIFGNKLNYAISGSAPMPIWLLNWFDSTGIRIFEAYGISENIIPNACNTPQCYKFGTVGKAISPNEIRLSADNEIEVRGPGVFHSYLGLNNENGNITDDGYLRTGDEGEIDADGFISLKGRKADFFKTSTGKRISPLSTEKKLNQCPIIEHAFILGEGRKVPIACANLSPLYNQLEKEKTVEELRNLLSKILADCPGTQKPAAILLLLTEFTIQTGEITANLKLRKKHIVAKYAAEIDSSYELLQMSTDTSTFHQITDNCLLVKL